MRIKIDKSKKQIILEKYLKDKSSRKEIAAFIGCSEWKIRQILQDAPPRYYCGTCSKPLDKHNTKFCSKKCFYEGKRKYKNCVICGKKIHSGPRQRKYCEDCSSSVITQTANDVIIKRRNILLQLKGNKCKICGYYKCKPALHFHHKNREEKKFALSGNGLSGHTWEAILIEVEKCDLICANCHIEIEEKLRQQTS